MATLGCRAGLALAVMGCGLLLGACEAGPADDRAGDAATEGGPPRELDGDVGGPTATASPTPASPAPETAPAAPRRGAALPEPRTEVTGASWRGRIAAIGGLDADGAASARVDVYDPETDAWSPAPELPAALHHTAAASLQGRLFVVGGYTIEDGAWVPQTRVWSLGPDEQRWREEPALATARGALALAVAGDRLLAVGGAGGEGALASTEVLQAGSAAWQQGPALATAREHHAAVAVGGTVYAIAGRVGGYDNNFATVEALEEARWERAGALAEARSGIGAAAVHDGPCVAGGEEPGRTIAAIECRHGERWRVVGELEVPRHGLVVAALDGALHVIGGGPLPGLTVSDVHEILPVAAP